VLLHALHGLAPKYQWRLLAAHLNHRLRGRSSDADQRLVEHTAKRLGLKVITQSVDVRNAAAERRESIEMAARTARHEFLAAVARKNAVKVIALAHHADDQVELFLIRLLRGAGPDGLSGMKPMAASPVDRKIQLARPLLGLARAEIEEFARRERIRFREDASNQSIEFLRNRVRNKLLPYLERDFQPAIREIILRMMRLISADSEYVREAAAQWLAQPTAHFDKLHAAVQRRVLQLQLIEEGIRPDFELIEWLREAPERLCSAEEGIEVRRDRSGKISRRTPASPQFTRSGVQLNLHNSLRTQLDGVRVSWKVAATSRKAIVRQPGVEHFDADAVGARIVLRHWERGDRFQPIGMTRSVKLQDLFSNLKVPRTERHQRIVAVAENGEIFWVEGLRISEKFKLCPDTKGVLEWKWRR
jgi:tRNA(Ile)-lysidine synthase